MICDPPPCKQGGSLVVPFFGKRLPSASGKLDQGRQLNADGRLQPIFHERPEIQASPDEQSSEPGVWRSEGIPKPEAPGLRLGTKCRIFDHGESFAELLDYAPPA
jgi:hypothetical protein